MNSKTPAALSYTAWVAKEHPTYSPSCQCYKCESLHKALRSSYKSYRNSLVTFNLEKGNLLQCIEECRKRRGEIVRLKIAPSHLLELAHFMQADALDMTMYPDPMHRAKLYQLLSQEHFEQHALHNLRRSLHPHVIQQQGLQPHVMGIAIELNEVDETEAVLISDAIVSFDIL